ncbi:MAG: hypothetical protein MJK10_21150 [Pseudomonadales bacterium]|nr:hypothetical protein [Pseudomonadales bacterium]NRA18507.1 hypothetical protein [Oceanospirillaceae bacterium]
MKLLGTLLLLVFYSSSMMAREDFRPMLDQLCKETWPGDHAMQILCKTQQTSAFHRIQAKSQRVDLELLQSCAQQWNINFVKVDACIEQRDRSLAKGAQQPNLVLPEHISSSIVAQCKNVWNNNQQMVKKCYEQQASHYGSFQ